MPYRPIGDSPYAVTGPVGDAKMFFGRDDLLDFLRGELVRPPELGGASLVVLWGARRMGKSSLLAQVTAGRLGPGAFPVFVDLDQLPRPHGSAGFWRMLALRAVERLRAAGVATSAPETEIPGEHERAPNERFRKFLQALITTLGGVRPVFVLDGYEALERWVHAGATGVDVIDGLAGVLDANLPVSLLLAGAYRMDQRDPETWGRLGARAVHRQVSFLARDAAERLLREPVAGRIEFDGGVLDGALRATAGHPFLLQAVGAAIVARLADEERNRCTKDDLEEALDAADDEAGALPLFVAWWRSLGFLGRVVTSVVASEVDDADGWVPLDAAEAALSEDRGAGAPEVDRAAFRGALDALVASEDLEGDATRGYRFRADLVRRWVAAAHPVWEVARCVADEPEAPAGRGVRRRLRSRPFVWFWFTVIVAAVALLAVRSFFPGPDERAPGAGPPVAPAAVAYARAWRLAPDLVPSPALAEDPATARAETGRLVAFRADADGARLDVTISWPTGVPAAAAGWLDALRRPEESWLWGIAPELAPDPAWLAGADDRYATEPPAGTPPAWLAELLAPAARLVVDYEHGYPAHVRIADRTGWTRQEWCVRPGAWERCVDDGTYLQRIAFEFAAHGASGTPLLSRVRFLSRDGAPAPDALGRTALEFLYRDVDPDPRGEQWEIETAIATYLRARPTRAGPAPFAPPAGWQGLGTGGVALSGERAFLFYFRQDRGAGQRGGEIVALQSRDQVGRAAGLGLAWGPGVETIFFSREGTAQTAFFIGTDGNPVADAVGAYGYREERTADGVRTRLTLLGPDARCVAGERTEGTAQVSWCSVALYGVPGPALAPAPEQLARLAAPRALAFADAAGPAPDAQGAVRFSTRDLGAAPPPCTRLLAVQHHDATETLIAPTAGPFTGSATTRLAVRFDDGRLADLLRTDCADGPCTLHDVAAETWSCNEHGCVASTVPLECKAP